MSALLKDPCQEVLEGNGGISELLKLNEEDIQRMLNELEFMYTTFKEVPGCLDRIKYTVSDKQQGIERERASEWEGEREVGTTKMKERSRDE